MISPYGNKPMKLRFREITLDLKGEAFPVTAIYYYCAETNQEFTTNELDELTLYQLYWLYAEKHGLPLEEVMPKRDDREDDNISFETPKMSSDEHSASLKAFGEARRQQATPTDPIDGYPCGTNDSLAQIYYHLLRISQAIDIHLQHQERLTNNARWRTLVMLAASNIRHLRNEVEQLSKDEQELLSRPGDTITETMEALDIDLPALALSTGIMKSHLMRIIIGADPITPAIAQKLERALNIDAQFWLNSEANYREKLQNLQGKWKPQPHAPNRIKCGACHTLQVHTYPMSGKLYCVNCGALIDEIYPDE